jgi:cytochrome b subunit of formate dehydrogenase
MALLKDLIDGTIALPLWVIIANAFFLVITGVTISRLYFSPLSAFPGPKLAAMTSLYEFYWNVIRGGQFTLHFQDLHSRYGRPGT